MVSSLLALVMDGYDRKNGILTPLPEIRYRFPICRLPNNSEDLKNARSLLSSIVYARPTCRP